MQSAIHVPNPARRQTRRRCVALLLVVLQLGGCFRYVPVTSPIPPGSTVSVSINDAGRSGLTEQIGPSVRRINGQLLESTDSVIVLSMNSVEYFDVNVAVRMAGERVELPRRYVSEFSERRLSKSRTWLTIGLVAVGLAAATLIGISGFGTDGGSDRPDDGGNGDQ